MIFSPPMASAAARTGITWDEPTCLLCGGVRRTPVLEAPDPGHGINGLWFAVVRCDVCGLCFTSPRPDADSIGQFYAGDYRPHRRPRRRPPDTGLNWLYNRFFGRTSVERRPLPWHGQGRLLDFGCGGGAFLALMHRRGWQVTGVDVSAEAVDRLRSELGVPVLEGSLPHPDLAPESFDIVTMWHALEHVHEPLAVLREAHRLLAPGGRLVTALPNIDSLPFRWFGPAWFGLELPRHLTHFTPGTLRRMLETAGFRVVDLRLVRHSDWLRSSAELAGRFGRRSLWQRTLTRKLGAKLAVWGCHLLRQSDCMTAVAEKSVER